MNENPLVPDQRDLLRLLGGVLFAAGAVIVFFREADNWAEFPLLLTVLIPCALLYGLGVAGAAVAPAQPGVAGPRVAAFPWQTVYLVFGTILVPIVLFQFLDTVGGKTDDSLNTFWIFLVAAAAGLFASFRRGVRYAAFLAGVALLIAWLALWDKILGDPSANTIRWLLLIFAVLMAVAALALWDSWQPQGLEYLTVAGLAILGVGLLSVTELAEQVRGLRALDIEGAGPNFFWNAVLLLSALGLILFAGRTGARGSGYMGALILIVFMLIVGFDLASRLDGDEASTKLGFWDIALLLLGALGVGASFLLGARAGPPDQGGAPAGSAPGRAAEPPGQTPPAT